MTNPSPDSALKSTPYEQAVHATRFLSVDIVEKSKSGHPGAPMGLANIAVELFAKHIHFNPADPSWPNRDRFVLSCGHASALMYSILHLTGYDVSIDDLKEFRQWGSKTPGHPEVGHTAGVETTTGPLGQGVCNAIGLAVAGKMGGARVNSDKAALIDYNVFCIASDGDLMEGVSYEACSLAGHLKLDNLVVVYDSNSITIDGTTDVAFTEDVGARFEAFGWTVQKVDGHDGAALGVALEAAKKADRPALIIAKTHIGFGSPNKQDTSGSHGSPLGPEETKLSKEAAGWPVEPAFFVSDAARAAFDDQKAESLSLYDAWHKTVKALPAADKSKLDVLLNRSIPENLLSELVKAAGEKKDATRSISGNVEQKVAELIPAFVGGSADLAASNKTWIKDSSDINAGDFSARNFNFGIREHGMGAILNGIALSGMFIPFGSTFLIFSDYMRPPMRLAALMKQQVVYVYTHDSIFLGEDGPTHQPVEQLWSMRMVPGLDVVRPADTMECAAAWAHVMTRRDGPSVLSLTRHAVPPLKRPEGFDPKTILQGGYVLSDVENPDLILMATGSEVCEAVTVQEILAKKGKRVRVVSMPCVDAFLRLPKAKQDEVLPPGVRRASYELGVTLPWKALTGLDGIEIGVDKFGASAPYQILQKEYEVSPEQAAEKILAAL